MVEVVSASPADERRDRVEKMDEYAAFGVSYYWIVDPALGSVEIFELQNGRFARSVAVTAGTLRDVPGFGARARSTVGRAKPTHRERIGAGSPPSRSPFPRPFVLASYDPTSPALVRSRLSRSRRISAVASRARLQYRAENAQDVTGYGVQSPGQLAIVSVGSSQK